MSPKRVDSTNNVKISITKDALFECEEILRRISPVHYYISPDSIKPVFQEFENIRRMQNELASDRFSPIIKERIKAMERGECERIDGIPNELVMEGTKYKMLSPPEKVVFKIVSK